MCFTPPLIELICSPTFTPAQWHVLIEIQFGAPKFNDSVQPLSFGTLLSAAGTFTKALALVRQSSEILALEFLVNRLNFSVFRCITVFRKRL